MVVNTIREFLFKNSKKPLNIHCVGDAMVDEYYQVKVDRISPEFPMPIMTSAHDRPVRRPGGVANVAYQFKHFNVANTLVCLHDPKANKVFRQHGVFPCHWLDKEDIRPKLPIKRRFLDGNVQVKRWDIESPNCGLTRGQLFDAYDSHSKFVENHKMNPDVVVFSDYNKGFLSSDLNICFPETYKNAITIVDPKKGPLDKWRGCTVLKLNAKEARELTGYENWEAQAGVLMEQTECEAVVITFGGEKVGVLHSEGEFLFEPEGEVNVLSVVGAGDCFAAFFAMAMGHHFSVPEAVQIAYRAGSVYVQHSHNEPVCPAELAGEGITQPQYLAKRNFKLVFTNGCFDVLHKGHMETLKFAKSKGDKLVVAVNSDESVKRLKGDSRPVVPLEHRMAVLESLEFVDYVVSFDSDTPLSLIRMIEPDVLVKGGDYKKETIIGADLVKEVYTAPMIEGVSTSKLLAN